MAKVLIGKVLRDQNDKTLVVSVETSRLHPLYGKYITLARKYHVHDEANRYKVGDVVKFSPCRPISKMKKWSVVEE